MARSPSSNPRRAAANLNSDQMRTGITRLNRRIEELQNFDVNSITKGGDSRILAFEKSIEETLDRVFGPMTIEQGRYAQAAVLHQEWGVALQYAARNMTPPPNELQSEFAPLRDRSIALLKQAVSGLEEELSHDEENNTSLIVGMSELGRRVFLVHGHDEGIRESVARFLENIGFQPIILHEQVNQGRTVIEKVQAYGDVGFAVVLLTPDDEGATKGGTPSPRARQNVILELGYFIGRLGRKHVIALKRDEVEFPSDFGGVVYEVYDANGGWKRALGRELQEAGYDIDWNKVMR
ncbi:MAG: nucleotide-binding protein [Methylovirgula sp.]|uniref:nucleotide-binding protein n=1 Tax=Methylovirgula sp. TaxID=1978224 RepID=UPI0030761706